MPKKFSTEAANADRMSDDDAQPPGMSEQIGADGTPRDRADRTTQDRGDAKAGGKTGEPRPEPAKPGKDINAPGFLKDKDGG